MKRRAILIWAAAGAWDLVATNPSGETATLAAGFEVLSALWSESFDGSYSGWTSSATTGSNAWTLTPAQAHSPTKSFFAPGPATKTTCSLTSPGILIPANATNLQLKFWYRYELQSARDGGRLEFSVDGGAWFDANGGTNSAFASNGYNSTISSTGNPSSRSEFAGRSAWSGNSNGFIETVVNLTNTSAFAGKTLRVRWVLATDGSTSSAGWYVDSISLTGGGNLSNQAPTLSSATSSSTETVTDPDGTVFQIVRGRSIGLSASASDDGGESALVYQVGVRIQDAAGLASTGSVNIRVLATADSVGVSPALASITVGGQQAFAATLFDQFGLPMPSQPASFTWGVSGGGVISSAGIFSASVAGGPYSVSAASGGMSGLASVSVNKATATVTLGNLTQTHDGSAKPVSVTTNPTGLTVNVTYNGSATAPSAVGSYAVEAVVVSANYQGSATGTLVIEQGLSPFESWADSFGLEGAAAGPLADPDRDGHNNLLEYATASSPVSPGMLPVTVGQANGTLTLSYTRIADPSLTYTVEVSDDLGASWSVLAVTGNPSSGTDNVAGNVTVTDPVRISERSRRFLRLRVTGL